MLVCDADHWERISYIIAVCEEYRRLTGYRLTVEITHVREEVISHFNYGVPVAFAVQALAKQ